MSGASVVNGYLQHKTITSQNVSAEGQVKNFFYSVEKYVSFSSCARYDIMMSISTWDSSFYPEVCDRMCMHQHTPKSIYSIKNRYVQISITNIASYVQKLSS